MTRLIFSPVSLRILAVLVLLIIIGLPLLFFGIIGAALANLGLNFWIIVLLIIAAIVGSFINIPITKVYESKLKKNRDPEQPKRKPSGQYAPSMYDKMYDTGRFVSNEPVSEGKGTLIAINVGGALIPVIISAYVIFTITPDMWYVLKLIGATAVVTAIAYFAAKPVKGIGIAIPFFIPLLSAVILGLVLGGGLGIYAAGIGYVAGTVGTLIGADLLHIKDAASESTRMMSVGGAGTFDGIFITGIIAALLAAL